MEPNAYTIQQMFVHASADGAGYWRGACCHVLDRTLRIRVRGGRAERYEEEEEEGENDRDPR